VSNIVWVWGFNMRGNSYIGMLAAAAGLGSVTLVFSFSVIMANVGESMFFLPAMLYGACHVFFSWNNPQTAGYEEDGYVAGDLESAEIAKLKNLVRGTPGAPLPPSMLSGR
jgi:hypothetical protein